MRKVLLLTLALAFCLRANGQTESVQVFYNAARDAYKKGDVKTFYSKILAAHKLHPYHQVILYQAGIAAALNNEHEEALDFLARAIQIRADLDLGHPDLKTLYDLGAFKALKEEQAQLLQPIIKSDTAFTVNDRLLHVECIAPGENENVFFLGNIHKRKIVKVDVNGGMKDFTQPGQDGLTSVLGIRIDHSKKLLWACASPMPEMQDFDSAARSAVFKYDAVTGALLAKFPVEDSAAHLFGDLVLDPEGNVFVSDSRNNTIYRVNETTGKLEMYFSSTEFWNLQGLAFNEDGSFLYIADYIRGLYRLETKDKTLKPVAPRFVTSIKSIDGLTFYNNTLIAIQNGVFPMRVTQYTLNEQGDELAGFTILDRAHPSFNEPTTGCVVKNTFYYVANSQWSGYDEHRSIKPADQLQDVVILKAELKK